MKRNGAPETEQARGWRMTALALSMLLASLGTSIANIALPTLATTFSSPFSHVQGVVVAYLAAMTVSTVVAGRLGDIYGLKRVHLCGLGLFSLASLLCGLAPNLGLLITARAIQGASAAFLMTLTMALMRETANRERMGRAMGLLGTVFGTWYGSRPLAWWHTATCSGLARHISDPGSNCGSDTGPRIQVDI